MDIFRCAVVSTGDVRNAAAEVVATLTQCGDFEPFECAAVDVAGTEFSVVVFVTEVDAIGFTLQRIGEVRNLFPATAIVVAVPDAGAGALSALLDAGAYDFVLIPFVASELIARLRRALGVWPAPRLPQPAGSPQSRIRGLVYASAKSAEVAAKLSTVAGCDANVLIVGETGTGKEVCAQAIHYLSRRATNPWIAVNCGAIPGELVENELFGHVKGAYTTAHTARSGLVREAEGGTLFLDDVDSLPLAAQAKLLRFLQEGEYRQVGSNSVTHTDVRVIAASNCDLKAQAMRGGFRQDLYFRLNVLRLNLPALRERREDIPVLALHFMRQFAREFARPVSALTPSAMRRLIGHHWPGNVRELKHVVERAVLLCSGPALLANDIEIESDEAADTGDESFSSAKSRVVREFERGYLEQLLTACCGNVAQAARAAKKDRRAFFELMRKNDIVPQRFRSVHR